MALFLNERILNRMACYRPVKRRPISGPPGGAWRSRRKGGAVEFADYRGYVPGDEPRRVDWKAYARLGRLYIKEFLDERQDSAIFLLDTSASMDWGGAAHKGRFALHLAAGMAAAVLAGGDCLALAAAGGFFVAAGGPRSLPGVLKYLQDLGFSGGADPVKDLQAALAAVPGATSLYVFSDLLDPGSVEKLLSLSAGRSLEVTLLQVLAPEERHPQGSGEWVLIDAETGARVEVSLTPAVLLDYTRRLEEYLAGLDSRCRYWGARRILLDSGEDLEVTLFKSLPGLGVIRPRQGA